MAGSNKSNKRKTVEYGRYGYFFIAPFFIVYAAFQLWPLLYTIGLSFCELFTDPMWNQTVGPNFNGIANYKEVLFSDEGKFLDTYTINALWNTILMWFINFIPQIVLALILAAWFTDTKVKLKGQGAYKVMVFMPNIITAATISVLFYSLFNFPKGPVNISLQELGVLKEPFNFLNSKWAARLIIAFINFWMWYGNTMIVLIAGILGISPSLFEAARVDGANAMQIFFKITLPLLRPILLYTLVQSAVGGLQMYDIPKLLTQSGNGDPDYTTRTITMYIQSMSQTGSKQIGKAAASSMVLFAVTLIISLVMFYVMRDKDAIKEKKMIKEAQRRAKQA
ncbi:carbohydrate ABC transporter permease [[Clostridium] polysaccharolyticum]|uniref:Carbohydrate ABC transporter membrane protein 1, CUT1 family (TC 3.A.1.1.-) n=1 Tax=[Clostridium] polysaccharolyticum TaxID=29364 RepID=A0A1I0BTZ8_9FIRM|nr:sugar ABC transporter permease [[Clostridium] polysaccharolyticum]SET10614.1 carbohydrate ABC transporter membrane protein 1, CUT1 family (TC 3.A.1.1.-) [[Clostridium] polysaccharolyticum]